MGELFADRDLAEAHFRSVNLQRARFEDANLADAVIANANLQRVRFENVNLAEAVIANANLRNLLIEDADISGLTIYGMRIDELIAAEFERRDPVRAQLRIADPTDPQQVRAVMARVLNLRAGFRAGLRAAAPHLLIIHPQPDQWSALEHVRHLLFSDDLYLNRWIRGLDQPPPALGQLPAHLAHDPAFATVGSAPSLELEQVLAAWEAIEATLPGLIGELGPEDLRRTSANGAESVGEVLQGLALHTLDHIRAAEGALASVVEASEAREA